MKVIIDSNEGDTHTALNAVKIVIDGDDPNMKLHITVTEEGFVFDAVRGGEILATQSVGLYDILQDDT